MAVRRLAAAAAVAVLLMIAPSPAAATAFDPDRWLSFAAQQLSRTVAEVGDRKLFPHTAAHWKEGARQEWSLVTGDHWVAGFLPGLLWQLYNATREARWRRHAHRWTMLLRHETKHHDLGMKVFYSFGLGRMLTGDPEYLLALREACRHLARRYRALVGALPAWGRPLIIIDTLLNVQLFAYTYHAVPADDRPAFRRYYDMALAHINTTIRELIKPDGSTYHVFEYHPRTGKVLRHDTTPQGYGLGRNRSSVWARGQAWAMYALPALYQWAPDHPEYLEAAVRASDWYLAHLPAGRVPYWDFGVPLRLQKYDTSTAACAAAGLLHLARYVDAATARRYVAHATATLEALTKGFLADPDRSPAILTQAVSVYPAQHSIIYADYFFVEALLRLRARRGTGVPSP